MMFINYYRNDWVGHTKDGVDLGHSFKRVKSIYKP
jgi:hypothetical protein